MRILIAIFCGGLLLSCSSGRSKRTRPIELFVTPHAMVVLYSDVDSLRTLLHPVQCRRTSDCYTYYSAPDRSFAIGFSLDTNTSRRNVSQWLQIDVEQRQIEAGGQLAMTVVDERDGLNQCAYAYYEKDEPYGHVSYFFGVILRGGYAIGMYAQTVKHDAQAFTAKCVPLLKSVEMEAP